MSGEAAGREVDWIEERFPVSPAACGSHRADGLRLVLTAVLFAWLAGAPAIWGQGKRETIDVVVVEDTTRAPINNAEIRVVFRPREGAAPTVLSAPTGSDNVGSVTGPPGQFVFAWEASHPDYRQVAWEDPMLQEPYGVRTRTAVMERKPRGEEVAFQLWSRSVDLTDRKVLRLLAAIPPPGEQRAIVDAGAVDAHEVDTRSPLFVVERDSPFDLEEGPDVLQNTPVEGAVPAAGDGDDLVPPPFLFAFAALGVSDIDERSLSRLGPVNESRSWSSTPGAATGPGMGARAGASAFSLVTAARTFSPARWGFLETSFGPSGAVVDYDLVEVDPGFTGFFTSPQTMDRGERAGAFFYDHESRRFLEIDTENERVHPDFAPGGSGRLLDTLFGGWETRAIPLLEGGREEGGTLIFSSRSTTPATLFDFTCRSGQSTLFLTEYDGQGSRLAEDALGPAIDTSVGHGCFPPHTQQTSATRFGESFGVAYQVGDELRWTTRSLRAGSEPATFSLGALPKALEGIYFWQPALLGDEDSGGYLIDLPGGDAFEGAEDGALLGIAPWRLVNPVLDLPLVANGEQLVHGLASDFSGLGWLIGTFSRADLDEAGASGGSSAFAQRAGGGDLAVAEVALPGCLDTDVRFCANHNRFAITARYETPQGATGEAQARPLSNDSGTFWFFDRDNRELIVKVLDACGVNGHYWFFVAGLTDVGIEIEAWDRLTGKARLYANPIGRPFEPILDTSAFACGASEAARAFEASAARVRSEREPQRLPNAARSFAGQVGGAACGGDPEDLCLNGGRFRVEVDYTDFSGATDSAFGGNLTDDTGALFFFDDANVEMLIKVLDACAFGGYWVFASGLTNVGVDIRVTDTETGRSATYRNPRNTPFAPITDVATFDICP